MSEGSGSLNLGGVKGTRLSDYWELTKPEVTALVVASALTGFYVGSPNPVDVLQLLHTLLGTALVAGGTGAFNQFLERQDDARMRRTAQRPLPAGRLPPRAAFRFAAALSAGGVLYLAVLVNLLASLLALLTWATYLFLYTPLKKRTALCTAVGAFPGAMPPLIGWAAARNTLSPEAWILYAILFLWQFPHFLSIAWIYREDYARGCFLMLPATDVTGSATGRKIAFYSTALLPLGAAPALVGMAGAAYFWGALLLGGGFLHVAIRAAARPSNLRAKHVLHASVIYLPLLFALLMLDKR